MNEVSSFAIKSPEPARFTVAEFEQLCATKVFDGQKLELVDGVIIRMNVPIALHSLIARQIYEALNAAFLAGPDGRLVLFELGVQLDGWTWRQIDVAVVKQMQPSGRHYEAQDILLAVEVANSSIQYDLVGKSSDYARGAIPFYWVIDPNKEVVHIMWSPVEGEYAERRRVAFGQPIEVPGTSQTITVTRPL